jgi:hypothetical protein
VVVQGLTENPLSASYKKKRTEMCRAGFAFSFVYDAAPACHYKTP